MLTSTLSLMFHQFIKRKKLKDFEVSEAMLLAQFLILGNNFIEIAALAN